MRKTVLAALFCAVCVLSALSFIDFHPRDGFTQGERAAHLPAFLTFAVCALILPNRWFRITALILLVIDYFFITLSFGYPSPGVSLAFLLTLAGVFFVKSQAGE